jgi:hypothetical protein
MPDLVSLHGRINRSFLEIPVPVGTAMYGIPSRRGLLAKIIDERSMGRNEKVTSYLLYPLINFGSSCLG